MRFLHFNLVFIILPLHTVPTEHDLSFPASGHHQIVAGSTILAEMPGNSRPEVRHRFSMVSVSRVMVQIDTDSATP
jgi:hypothetical protein